MQMHPARWRTPDIGDQLTVDGSLNGIVPSGVSRHHSSQQEIGSAMMVPRIAPNATSEGKWWPLDTRDQAISIHEIRIAGHKCGTPMASGIATAVAAMQCPLGQE